VQGVVQKMLTSNGFKQKLLSVFDETPRRANLSAIKYQLHVCKIPADNACQWQFSLLMALACGMMRYDANSEVLGTLAGDGHDSASPGSPLTSLLVVCKYYNKCNKT